MSQKIKQTKRKTLEEEAAMAELDAIPKLNLEKVLEYQARCHQVLNAIKDLEERKLQLVEEAKQFTKDELKYIDVVVVRGHPIPDSDLIKQVFEEQGKQLPTYPQYKVDYEKAEQQLREVGITVAQKMSKGFIREA